MMQNLLIYALFGAVLCAFAASFYACRRVAINEKALAALDWETLANLTGEVGAIKRSLQKTNSRISGMTSSDPMASLAELQQLRVVQTDNVQERKGG